MNTFIENQNWRYATKKFDPSKKINNPELEILKEAIRLSTSSFGLQPYKVLIIEDKAMKEKLLEASWGQSQIVDASHIFVFANYTDIKETHIDEYVNNICKIREIENESIKGYGDFMKSKLIHLPNEIKNIWTSKQTYLALGNLINAAAELKIDVTPMEGFEPDKYNHILDLEKKGLCASLVAPAGYRHEEDTTQHYKKVRKSKQELFITI